MQLFKHVGVAVLETTEKYLNLLKNILFGLRGVDPFGQVVEQLLLEKLAVLFSPQVCVDLRDAPGI